MNTKEAVAERIKELCNERDLKINGLANLCGVSPSTVYSLLNTKSKNPGVVTIKIICDGLDISVREFFDSDLFNKTEQEIKQGLILLLSFVYSVFQSSTTGQPLLR